MSLIKSVLDTNVVVSALLIGRGHPALILDLSLASKIQSYVTAEILAEYDGVLRRPRFGLDPALVTATSRLINRKSKVVTAKQTVTASPDPADNKFLECAEAAKADYLVTGNKRHFPAKCKNTRVVNAREFLELITPEL